MKNITELFSLKGKTAIVTGGTGRYGAHISEALCEAGANVVIASRNVERCREYAEGFCAKGYEAVGMKLDLSSDESIKSAFDATLEKYGSLDVLVNNAYDFSKLRPALGTTREEFTASYDVNINGTMVLTQLAIEQMQRQGGGSIVMISSMRGTDCPHFPFYPETWGEQALNYTTEKWAMVGMTKYLAGRFGKDNIRVNAICPGGFDPTLLTNPDKVDFVKTYVENVPLKRWADEDDIKGPVVFLASDASAYVTGEAMLMDGGWTIW